MMLLLISLFITGALCNTAFLVGDIVGGEALSSEKLWHIGFIYFNVAMALHYFKEWNGKEKDS